MAARELISARGHVEDHGGDEAQQGEHAHEATHAFAWAAGDHAGDRHHHQNDRDRGQTYGEDPHAVYETAIDLC